MNTYRWIHSCCCFCNFYIFVLIENFSIFSYFFFNFFFFFFFGGDPKEQTMSHYPKTERKAKDTRLKYATSPSYAQWWRPSVWWWLTPCRQGVCIKIVCIILPFQIFLWLNSMAQAKKHVIFFFWISVKTVNNLSSMLTTNSLHGCHTFLIFL